MEQLEGHRITRIGWLRAAVLGANDGIISTASLLIGVAAAKSSYHTILIAGFAGLVAGAMSMAAGEYISVSSQADTEKAELQREKKELEANFPYELDELTSIYMRRGLDQPLARQVAEQLMQRDALGAHARDELGITEIVTARPFQAAIFSAFSFAMGAFLPLLVAVLSPLNYFVPVLYAMVGVFLVLLGIVAANIGGSNKGVGAFRVFLWGYCAMAMSAVVGHLAGGISV